MKRILSAFGAACLGLFFFSCQQFFTTSLAAPLARDPADYLPAVTAENAADLAAEVEGDPDAALVVLEGLEDLIADADLSEQADLLALALDVASSASGVGDALLANAGDILSLVQDETLDADELFAIVDDAIGSLDNLEESAAVLAALLSGGTTIDDIAAESNPEDLAMAAIVLLSSEAAAAPGGVEGYLDTFDPNGALTAEEQLAVDLATAAADLYAAEGGTGPLADILDALGLF
jgi:hypothetical protein